MLNLFRKAASPVNAATPIDTWKPHIFFRNGQWSVITEQGEWGWHPPDFLGAQKLALHAYRWHHYKCSATCERSPLYQIFLKLEPDYPERERQRKLAAEERVRRVSKFRRGLEDAMARVA